MTALTERRYRFSETVSNLEAGQDTSGISADQRRLAVQNRCGLGAVACGINDGGRDEHEQEIGLGAGDIGSSHLAVGLFGDFGHGEVAEDQSPTIGDNGTMRGCLGAENW